MLNPQMAEAPELAAARRRTNRSNLLVLASSGFLTELLASPSHAIGLTHQLHLSPSVT